MQSIFLDAFRRHARERRKAKCEAFFQMLSDNMPVSFASGRYLKRRRTGDTLFQEDIIMLKGIPPILSPELLKALAEMGHTDELTIGDGNFPGHSFDTPVIRMDGHGVPEILDAILQVLPLDTYPDANGVMVPPCTLMAVEPGDDAKTPIWDTYKEIVAKYDERGDACFEEINKWDFYDKTRAKSKIVIMTSETAIYANIILRKGVVINK